MTEPDDMQQMREEHWTALDRLRWVHCEVCGGSGEIIRREPNARDPSDEYAEICAACEGTGRDCVEPQ